MKILVVDDNIDNVDMMMLMLKSKNYDVKSASNGREALDILHSEKFDLIISDILMPVMDGFQLCRECKKDDELCNICFVFYTATYIDNKDEEFALSLGAQKFIRKPQEPEVFLDIIKEVIEKSKYEKNNPTSYLVQDEKEIFKLYSERLIAKLEKKNIDLEKEIASHKITVSELKESEERFRSLFQNNLSVMLLIDPDTGQIVDANHSAVSYYGWSYQQLTSIKIQDIDTLNEGTLAEMEKARSQKQVHFEFRHKLANGSIHDVEVFSSRINICGKEFLHSIIHDITESKHAKELFIASETRYRRLFESAKDGILILDTETGKIVDVNPFLIELLGYSREQLIEKAIWEIGFFKDIMANKNKFLELLQKEYVRYEDLPIETADGRTINVEFVSNVYSVNHHKVIQCNIRDITERKQAEDALGESEKKLREAQEMAHLGFWHWDIKTGDVEWSDEVYKIFRLDPKEFAPHIDSVLALSPWPEDRERDKELIDRAIKDHSPGFYEQKFLRPDQSIGYYYSTFQGNYNENGDLISIIGTVLDITERKRAEAEIHILNTELEHRVEERTIQLEAANKELEAFSYSVSHDLRTPLRAIKGFTRILLEDYSIKLDDEGKRICTVICNNVNNMGQLIDNMLKFSKINRTDLQIVKIDMKEMAESIFNEMTTTEMRQRIKFQLNNLTHASGDEDLIRQIWSNLISNAIKYSSKSETAVISIKQKLDNDMVIYCIKDNGAGFDMKHAGKLFTVFQRFHSPKDYEGTGVGLAIVQRIIHRHGGQVWAESEVDKGASFYFSLPV